MSTTTGTVALEPQTQRGAHRHRGVERGSAYIVALLALLVLTIGGLSVSMITQTEMQIGMNERSITRGFYAAESAVNLVTAYLLTNGGRCTPFTPLSPRETFFLPVSIDPALHTADTAEVAAANILFKGCCNWCPCQEGENDDVSRFNFGVTANAQRIAWGAAAVPAGEVPTTDFSVIARKNLGAVIDVQPFVAGEIDRCLSLDPSTFGTVRF